MDPSPLQQPLQNTYNDASSPRTTGYRDPAAAIFSMYITRVQKFEDERDVENWRGGAEGILVFTGLFSSTVATFIALSYPSLQKDPNVTTQLLLAQISQQLSNNSITTGSLVQSSFVPPTSVVFINSVWFLSLVLSLMCALMATLVQQWARRYLQIVQRKYAPLHHARIHEYFSRGARRFGIFGFVEVLPLLLLISVSLFFAGLVVFAFRGNHIVAYVTLAIVGFCALSYLALTLMSFIFHDCPYQTPLTPALRFFAQVISLSYFSVLYHGANRLHKSWGAVSGNVVESLDQRKNKARFMSVNIISKLENSAEPLSINLYKNLLVRTLHWLNEDHELEEFVAGIPGLYESEAFTTQNDDDVQHTIRPVLAVLPGLMSSHMSLPWNIIQLAQRTSTSKLPKSVQQRRIRACLRSLYYIPGAIRDVLAPYAAGSHNCLEILPLLNSPESLEVIEELWDTPNDDVALSVRCAAAVVAAFMITPPRRTLDNFVPPGVGFVGDDISGMQFLAKRLRVSADADDGVAPRYHPRSDSARLQNIVRFLTDIRHTLRYMNTQWWSSDNAYSIRRERLGLFDPRHTEGYRIGHGTFDRHGNRASPAFVPAAQQDLITLTLEIMARDPVADTTTPQRQAFHDACTQLAQVMTTQAREQALAQMQVAVLEALAGKQARAAESLEMVARALDPVLRSLR